MAPHASAFPKMKTTVPPTASLDYADAPSDAAVDLHVLLAYENLAAALRATEMLATLSRKDPDGLAVQLSPWSFAALENSDWRAQAVPYAARAHLIVIAACGAVPRLSAAIEDWLQTCLAQPREDHLAVAALFHRHDRPDGGDSPRLRSVQRLAHEAGCAFFAPGVTGEIACLV